MNPKAKGMTPDRLPPLTEVRKNMRIRWYRCPIEPARLRELAEPSDSRGLLQATGHLGLWTTTGIAAYYLFKQEMWLGFCLVLFLHGTVAAFFTAPHHELCHTTVFKGHGTLRGALERTNEGREVGPIGVAGARGGDCILHRGG